jgi:hypothetical protein
MLELLVPLLLCLGKDSVPVPTSLQQMLVRQLLVPFASFIACMRLISAVPLVNVGRLPGAPPHATAAADIATFHSPH